MQIVPLDKNNVDAAIQLTLAQLPAQSAELREVSEGPETCLRHSLSLHSTNPAERTAAQKWAQENGIDRLQYFVALGDAGAVLGVSGIYSARSPYLERLGIAQSEITDRLQQPDHFWMAYTAVDPAKKGTGIGTALMKHGFKLAEEIADREHRKNPQWALLADPGAISFYEQFGMKPVLAHGAEQIFETPLAEIQTRRKWAKDKIVNIVPLDKKNLDAAVQLTLAQLPAQSAELGKVAEDPRTCFENSLALHSLDVTERERAEKWARDNGIYRLQYFVATDEAGSVLGISGIYSNKSPYLERMGIAKSETTDRLQQPDHFWMDYTAVDSAKKGQGIGTALMKHGLGLAQAIANREHIPGPKWALLADHGAISFYEQLGMKSVLAHGTERIFETPMDEVIKTLEEPRAAVKRLQTEKSGTAAAMERGGRSTPPMKKLGE